MWILYRFSDALFCVLYHGIGYRRRVVAENLRNSFPEKSANELESLTRDFYRHLCDLILESVKGCTISRKEIARRHCYANIELLERYFEQGRRVTILGAHVGNWEWVALSLPLATRFQTYGIFQKMSNPFMNKAAKRSRERHGMKLIGKKEVASVLRDTRGDLITMGYIGDQSPSPAGRNSWLEFLNQETAITTGFEHFAREHDMPVVYLNITKTKRGHYVGTFHSIAEEPRATAEGQIAAAFMRTLEKIIMDAPAHWLWSHRRWKLKRD
jgi:KDO2-lipid IV(A) lauroyltransferase